MTERYRVNWWELKDGKLIRGEETILPDDNKVLHIVVPQNAYPDSVTIKLVGKEMETN